MPYNVDNLSAIFQLYRGDQFQWWRSQSTRREPPIMGKQLVNFITCAVSRVHFFVIYQVGANPRFILLFSFNFLLQSGGAVVAMIVCWLDLQLPM
jgi:hypothetical protein